MKFILNILNSNNTKLTTRNLEELDDNCKCEYSADVQDSKWQ